MVSTLHQDAAEFFDRDVKCLQDFFRRRLTITSIMLAFYCSLKSKIRIIHGIFPLTI